MTDKVQPPASIEHEAVAMLLPWHANGTLTAGEQAMCDRHLATCEHCQRDAIKQQHVRQMIAAPTSEADAGWANMQTRILQDAPAPARFAHLQSRRVRRRWAATKTSWRMPVAAFGGATAALVAVMLVPSALPSPKSGPANYEVLSSATSQATAPAIYITVEPGLTEAAFRAALQSAAVEVRRGPTATGAWVLAPTDGDIPRALAALKKHPAVTFAIPLEVDEAR